MLFDVKCFVYVYMYVCMYNLILIYAHFLKSCIIYIGFKNGLWKLNLAKN
jgi:hypothetical protein